MRVLVVDDEEAIRETLRDVLEFEGFDVETASDAEEALAKLADGRYSGVILDLAMPGMSGAELYRRVTADPNFAHLRVIVSTSSPSEAPPGCTLVAKPIDPDVLVTKIRETAP